jgi:hypothetical protein
MEVQEEEEPFIIIPVPTLSLTLTLFDLLECSLSKPDLDSTLLSPLSLRRHAL